MITVKRLNSSSEAFEEEKKESIHINEEKPTEATEAPKKRNRKTKKSL